MITPETQLEQALIDRLVALKYEYRAEIRDRDALNANFREKFEALNRVNCSATPHPPRKATPSLTHFSS